VVAGAVMVLSLIIAGIMLAAGSGRTKDEAKGKVLWIALACFIVFGAVSLVAMFAGIANGAFN